MTNLVSESKWTTMGRIQMALFAMNNITNGNTYLGIGHNTPWGANDTLIDIPNESTDYLNQVHKNLCAIKQLSISTASLVIPRNDWASNTFIYDEYDETVEMFSYSRVANSNGTVSVSNSNMVVGTNTTFILDFANNILISIPGDGIYVTSQQREVINVINNTVLTVNSVFSANFVNNVAQSIVNTAPNYAKNFYVRNIYDQVFICLDNNNGTLSTEMPQISLGGQLPSWPYILTGDGYKWKYLYTMSGGLKKLFFTQNWMPVATDLNVLNASVNGRLDIIRIEDGGSGYNQNVATLSAQILTVSGDGTGANLTAQVDANGTIYDVNVLNGGEGYTTAYITANSGGSGSGANLVAIIGPREGFGSNNAYQLGATTLMVSTSLYDTENGTIPVEDGFGEYFKYRQLTIIDSPTLVNNSAVANGTNYDMTYSIQVSGNPGFYMNDVAFQSSYTGLYKDASFSGTVVWFDENDNVLHLNNVNGSFLIQNPIYGVSSSNVNGNPYVVATGFSISAPSINTFSGTDLYIENVPPISRYNLQTEEIRLILQF